MQIPSILHVQTYKNRHIKKKKKGTRAVMCQWLYTDASVLLWTSL